jgi:hypothetical protein
MQRLGTGYVRYFNRRHGRSGHLFQGRYKSVLVEDDVYLMTLVRYIHANPLRGGIVGSLDALADYPWTGYAALLSRRSQPFQLVDEVLARLSADPEEARRLLPAWMRGSDAHEPANARSATARRREVVSVAGAPLHRDAQMRVPRERAVTHLSELSRASADREAAIGHFGSLDELIERVCGALAADPADVRAGRRTALETRARAAIASVAKRQLGLSFAEMAESLGVTASALSRLEPRGAAIAQATGLTCGGEKS